MGGLCGGGGGTDTFTNTGTSTSSSQLDPSQKKALNLALPRVEDIMNQTAPSYDINKRFAGFNTDQNASMNLMRDYLMGAPNDAFGYASDAAQAYGSAPAPTIDIDRIVDEDGRLGAINDYMNPFLRNVLDPAISDIRDQGERARNDLDSQATMAGAFGDLRHGVADQQQRQNESEVIGDLTGRVMSAGYGDAMARRGQDQANFIQGDQFNVGAIEQALARLMGSGEAMMGLQGAQDQLQLGRMGALMGMGDRQQAQDQQVHDAAYEEHLRAVEWPFRGLDAAMSFLSGSPNAQTVTQTESNTRTQPASNDNSFWSGIGSVAGAIF